MVASSDADVPVDDFARLLAPGGMIDQFFDQYLKAFVDTTQQPWKWLSAERMPLGLSPSSLVEFERAAQIRDALFANGNQMQVRFQLVPVGAGPAGCADQHRYRRPDIDRGTTVRRRTCVSSGPVPAARTLVRVTMTPANGGTGADHRT